MAIKWNETNRERFDPSIFLNRLKAIAVVRGDNRVEFENADGFEALELESILSERMTFDAGVPDAERGRINRNAVIKCATSGNFNHDFFLQAASAGEQEYLSRPRIEYQLFSSLSIEYSDGLGAPGLGECQFAFFRSLPENIDRSELAEKIEFHFRGRPLPQNYSHVRVTTKGRTPIEAGFHALQTLELLRSVWNFQLNYFRGSGMFVGGGPPKINSIVAGPVATLHFVDGRLFTDKYWGDLEYLSPEHLLPATELLNAKKNTDWSFDRLDKHPFRVQLEDAFRRYGRALDKTDYDVALLELWSVMELLTDSSGNHETVVKRAAFVNRDVQYSKLMLNHIRAYRNNVIHAGHSSDSRNPAVHLIRIVHTKFASSLLTQSNGRRNLSAGC
jgi:hypothetical protein